MCRGGWGVAQALVVVGAASVLGCGTRPLDPGDHDAGGAVTSGTGGAITSGTGDASTGGAGASGGDGAPSGTGGSASVPVTCGCAPSGGIDVLACGQGFPTFAGRDAPEAMVSANGDTVVFNRCAATSGGSCSSDLVRWTAATGSVRLDSAWAYAVSADGTTILADSGDGSTGASQPLLWTPTGVTNLGLQGAYAHLLSADGLVVAARVDTANGVTQAALWRTTGLSLLGDLPGGPEYSEPGAINADGSVVVGYGNTTSGQEPFLWTAASPTMIDLGAIDEVEQTVALATSADGSAVAGTSLTTSGTAIFRWTAAGGMVALADHFEGAPGMPGYGFLWTPPILMSGDGGVVAGTSTNQSDPLAPSAFRWSASTGVVPLTTTDASIVRAASSEGSRVLGASVKAAGSAVPAGAPPPPGATLSFAPFVWDAVHGTQDLSALLQAAGADLAGLTLGDPIAMSADGGTVVGHATCGTDSVVFRAVLPP